MPFSLYAQLLLTMRICFDEFSQCTRKQVYVILVINLLISLSWIYEFMHGTWTTCSDNRGVRIIEVRIIEVGVYTVYSFHKVMSCLRLWKDLRTNGVWFSMLGPLTFATFQLLLLRSTIRTTLTERDSTLSLCRQMLTTYIHSGHSNDKLGAYCSPSCSPLEMLINKSIIGPDRFSALMIFLGV